jgi:hypothetical protein
VTDKVRDAVVAGLHDPDVLDIGREPLPRVGVGLSRSNGLEVLGHPPPAVSQ